MFSSKQKQGIEYKKETISCLIFLVFELVLILLASLFSLWILVAMILFVLVLWVIYQFENSIVFLVFLFIPILPFFTPLIHGLSLFLIVIVVVGLWFFRWIFNGFDYDQLPKYTLYFFSVFILLSIISSLNAQEIQYSLLESVRYISLFAFLFAMFQFITSPKQIKSVIDFSILGCLLMIILAVPDILKIGMPQLISGGIISNRLGSFYNNPNNFAIPFLFSIPALVCKIIFMEKKNVKDFVSFIGLIILLLVFGYVVLLTNSRSAFLSLFISFCVLMLAFRWGRWIMFISLISFLIILPFISDFIYTALRIAGGLTGREWLWKAAISMIQDNPLLGVGPGNFEFVKGYYILPINYISYLVRSQSVSGAAHSLFLTISSESGIITAVALFFFIIILFRKGYQLLRCSWNSDNRIILYTSIIVLSGLFIRGFFESGIIIGSGRLDDGIYFLLVVLIISRMDKYFGKSSNVNSRKYDK